ncbi:hypothetical protein BGP77_03920 [Saccharospirillum sp. MSK14-1]|nr:hypothetical protein BGP77_03920 [Saccharospirillum sp. MSK14-1]
MALDAQGDFAFLNDPYALVDSALLFILAFGVYKKSRYAALLLVGNFLVSKLLLIVERKGISTGALLLSLMFLYFYVKALQGCFAYKALEKQENPNYKKRSKWFYFAGLPVTAVIVVVVAILLIDYITITPSTQVQTARQVASRDTHALVANDILLEDERFDYFYSFSTDPMAEGGVLLTNDRLLMYLLDDVKEGYDVYGIPFDEVSDIELMRAGDEQTTSLYRVSSIDGFWLQFSLATQGQGDDDFIDYLKTQAINLSVN